MSQQEIEVILSRQLFSYLMIPIFLVDPEGSLLFYNEPAETILGRRYEETGRMAKEEWSTVFQFADEDGNLLEPDQVPLTIALRERRPVHRRLTLHGLDGNESEIEAMCFPLVGQADRFLGAVAMFWKLEAQ